METLSENKLICQICGNEFATVSGKNRHLRQFHPEVAEKCKPRTRRIICPLCCSAPEKFTFYMKFHKHLFDIHNIKVKMSYYHFQNFDEFTTWKSLDNRDVNYVCTRQNSYANDKKVISYHCNRSNCKGFESNCTKRNPKTGGSIRINAVCPSRIEITILSNGEVTVQFVETHVGHEDELRTKKLSKAEEKKIGSQLEAGVSFEKILHDARIIKNNKVERINLLTRADLRYLSKKYPLKVEETKCKQNEEIAEIHKITATALKVEDPTSKQDEETSVNSKEKSEDIGDIHKISATAIKVEETTSKQDGKTFINLKEKSEEITEIYKINTTTIKVEETISKQYEETSINLKEKTEEVNLKERSEEIVEIYKISDTAIKVEETTNLKEKSEEIAGIHKISATAIKVEETISKQDEETSINLKEKTEEVNLKERSEEIAEIYKISATAIKVEETTSELDEKTFINLKEKTEEMNLKEKSEEIVEIHKTIDNYCQTLDGWKVTEFKENLIEQYVMKTKETNTSEGISKKRKMENQTYFPNKK